ncbi:MAG: hypothetical protein DWQ44_03710 [Bacteroidetes bacterium]|nr:MAG: hypothetical protein DWQ44_03710 [Bacteroidota bacterium]REK49066.1 MAG: hypothetical protein DWQ48_09390 [Bacteroidota bacterium]
MLVIFFYLPDVRAQEITPTLSNYFGSNISCRGASDGFINIVVVGGTPPYLYNWSNGSFSKNQTGLQAGIYSVIVTDATGQSISDTFELKEPLTLSTNLFPLVREGGFHISHNGGNDGAISSESSGGTPPYSHLWSNTMTFSEISELTAGTYTLTVTDVNGCTTAKSVSLTQPTELQINSIVPLNRNGYHVSCADSKNGKIDLTVSGGVPPYSYQWNNGEFMEDPENLLPGNYWVIVRDANEAAVAAQVTLTAPPPLSLELSAYVYQNGKNISCYGCSNGSINSTVNGGVPPYTYAWEHGPTTAGVNSLGEADYAVLLTDANGCQAFASTEIRSPQREDWTMSGNAGTNPATQFVGTTDNKDLVFKTNNQESLRLMSDGNLKLNSQLGAGNKFIWTDNDGILRSRPISILTPISPVCDGSQANYVPLVWKTESNPVELFNCWQRFGLGTKTPRDLLEIKSALRITAWQSANDAEYIRIQHDGGSARIDNFGTGNLMINYGDAYNTGMKNVSICGGNSGNVTLGGNNYLAPAELKKVGIGTSNPSQKLEIAHADHKGGLAITNIENNNHLHSEIRFQKNDGNTILWSLGNDLGVGGNFGNQNFFIWNHQRFLNGANGTSIFINEDNKIGIDKSNPSERLDVNGNIVAGADDDSKITCRSSAANKSQLWAANSQFAYGFGVEAGTTGIGHLYRDYTQQIPMMSFLPDGAVGINITPSLNHDSNYKLYVDGSIAAREIKVTVGNFPDYVFENNYKLPTISDLEKYIKENSHLPGIPSAAEVESNQGLELGEFQLKLLEKIEEQALYIISLQKQIDFLNERINKN